MGLVYGQKRLHTWLVNEQKTWLVDGQKRLQTWLVNGQQHFKTWLVNGQKFLRFWLVNEFCVHLSKASYDLAG